MVRGFGYERFYSEVWCGKERVGTEGAEAAGVAGEGGSAGKERRGGGFGDGGYVGEVRQELLCGEEDGVSAEGGLRRCKDRGMVTLSRETPRGTSTAERFLREPDGVWVTGAVGALRLRATLRLSQFAQDDGTFPVRGSAVGLRPIPHPICDETAKRMGHPSGR